MLLEYMQIVFPKKGCSGSTDRLPRQMPCLAWHRLEFIMKGEWKRFRKSAGKPEILDETAENGNRFDHDSVSLGKKNACIRFAALLVEAVIVTVIATACGEFSLEGKKDAKGNMKKPRNRGMKTPSLNLMTDCVPDTSKKRD